MSSRDPDDEFREIKREIIESRGLIIKTMNATRAMLIRFITPSPRRAPALLNPLPAAGLVQQA